MPPSEPPKWGEAAAESWRRLRDLGLTRDQVVHALEPFARLMK